MTTTRVYRSTDSGAPVLVGGVSSLINLIDKCLVEGYGAKDPAGWTKPFAGTNKACFRNSLAAGGTGMYVRVVDDGTATGGARNALARAYLTMSDVDTGTIETPTAAQVAASIVWRKSNTVDATARPWFVVADELTFYLFIETGTTGTDNGPNTCAAGDFSSDVPGDAYRFFIAGRETQAAAGSMGTSTGLMTRAASLFGGPPSTACFWLARGYGGTGSPIRGALAIFGSPTSTAPIGGSEQSVTNPTPGTGLNYFHGAILGVQSAVRGRMRGLYVPLNSWGGTAAGTEVINPPGLAATLMALRHNSNGATYATTVDGHVFVDATSEWGL